MFARVSIVNLLNLLKCLWSKTLLPLIWKAFQSKEERRFPFWNIFFRFRDIHFFALCKWAKWCRHRLHSTTRYWIKNISRNIEAVFFKLGTRRVHHNRSKVTPTMLLPWQYSWLQSLSVKKVKSPFVTFASGTEGFSLSYRLYSPHYN